MIFFKQKNRPHTTMNSFILFYQERQPDRHGRYLGDILNWTDEELESVHNYIQELFPTDEPSQFNKHAPVFKKEEMHRIVAAKDVQKNILRSYERMLKFYGFYRTNCGGIFIDEERVREWCQPQNHNCLRVTRILKSLNLFGAQKEASELMGLLNSAKREHYTGNISDIIDNYWIPASNYKAGE